MGRAPCCDKANVKKGPWSPEEDAKLKSYIEKFGTGGNWIALPQKIGLKRCGKSCRLRWLNYLRPNIKHGGFTEEEDNIILNLYISIGSRWSIIAAQLPGRTDNDIKNYWNTRLKKKLLGRRSQPNTVNSKDNNNEDGNYKPTLSSSALERLQLHIQLQSQHYLLENNNNNNNSSFALYGNLGLWPKLHPLQEKIIQHNLLLNQNHDLLSFPLLQEKPVGAPSKNPNPHDYFPQTLNFQAEDLETSLNGLSSGNNLMDSTTSDGSRQDDQKPSDFIDDELNGLLMNNDKDRMAEFDSMATWWSNDSNSWDTTSSVLHSDQSLFQEFD